MSMYNKIQRRINAMFQIPQRIDMVQEALGRIESKLQTITRPQSIVECEFKVYSQWGEDGIINHLVNSVEIPNRTFVEFGVETYVEANTIFLLKHRNWRGLVIDGSNDNVAKIKGNTIYWRYDLMADCAFITKDNINDIIGRNGLSGDIGLLSVDIDGNDYWVWEAITQVNPRIVVAEYNSLFGAKAKVSIPYDKEFHRPSRGEGKMHYGASIAALTYLGEKRGYNLVAANSAGNNVFFVRNDCLGSLKPISINDAYVAAGFREGVSKNGEVDFLSFKERQSAIAGLPVIDVSNGRITSLGDVL